MRPPDRTTTVTVSTEASGKIGSYGGMFNLTQLAQSDAFDAAQRDGRMAFSFKGQMVDVPHLTRARTILNWEPKVGLDEGIHKTIPYFKKKLGFG